MTRQERKTVAARMRCDGHSYRAIADHLGVAEMTVYAWLNPAYRERSNVARINHRIRQLEAENRQLCERIRELESRPQGVTSFTDAQAYWLATVSPEEFERIARGLAEWEYYELEEAA